MLNLDDVRLVLIRGIPGSGKSTLAKEIAERWYFDTLETDNYWIRPDGTYDFNWKLLEQAHVWNQKCTDRRLLISRVIVSNVFSQIVHMQPYLDMTKDVRVLRMTTEFNSIHGVPETTVTNMKKKFENYPGETLVGVNETGYYNLSTGETLFNV